VCSAVVENLGQDGWTEPRFKKWDWGIYELKMRNIHTVGEENKMWIVSEDVTRLECGTPLLHWLEHNEKIASSLF